MFFSRPFSVYWRTSRSNNRSLGNCFVFVFINCIPEKLLFWSLVSYCFYLNCLTSFLEKTKKDSKVEWPLILTLNLSSRYVYFDPQYIQYGGNQFSPCSCIIFSSNASSSNYVISLNLQLLAGRKIEARIAAYKEKFRMPASSQSCALIPAFLHDFNLSLGLENIENHGKIVLTNSGWSIYITA